MNVLWSSLPLLLDFNGQEKSPTGCGEGASTIVGLFDRACVIGAVRKEEPVEFGLGILILVAISVLNMEVALTCRKTCPDR